MSSQIAPRTSITTSLEEIIGLLQDTISDDDQVVGAVEALLSSGRVRPQRRRGSREVVIELL